MISASGGGGSHWRGGCGVEQGLINVDIPFTQTLPFLASQIEDSQFTLRTVGVVLTAEIGWEKNEEMSACFCLPPAKDKASVFSRFLAIR